MNIRFLLLSEGSSEQGLIQHLQTLCVRFGAAEAYGEQPDPRRLPDSRKDVASRLTVALGAYPHTDLVFVHRDADSDDAAPVYTEIERAVSTVTGAPRYVAVVPVQEIEAWLLVDEAAIRSVVGNPNGTMPLDLPRILDIERAASPKERLFAALRAASGKAGRHLERVRRRRFQHRALLLNRLDIDGPVRQLDAWQRLERDTQQAVDALLARIG